jgi:hypothetical protein
VVRKEEKGIYTNTTYIQKRILERLEGSLKKGGRSWQKGERLCGEARGLLKKGKGARKVEANRV